MDLLSTPTTSPKPTAARRRLAARASTLGRRLPLALLLALPGALVVYTGFHAGGFFAGTQGLVVAGLALVLAAWILFADDPLVGASAPLVVAAGALAALAVWTLISSVWSGSPARAVLEFDRTLLYALALVVFGLLPMTNSRLGWMVRGVALGVVVVCMAGLVSRLLPELLPTTPGIVSGRLSYPVTYWNALGLLAALGLLLVLHGSCWQGESRTVRVLAAMAAPPLATTLLLTYSRGAIGVVVLALPAYLLLARPRLVVTGLVALAAPCALALASAYGAKALTTQDPTGPLAVAQGSELALVVALCVVAAGVLRLLGLVVDARICRRPPRAVPRRVRVGVVALAVTVGAAAFLAVGGPSAVADQARGFFEPAPQRDRGDVRDRLADPGSNGRVELWGVALDAWRAEPLHGHGAGTFQLLWNRNRPILEQDFDAHSLYLEMLAELGVVGLALLVIALGALAAGLVLRARGPDRPVYVAVATAGAAWALRAAVDWDWEMPVVTLLVFALAGAAIAVPRRARPEAPGRRGSELLRLVAALGVLVMMVMPVRVALSQHHLDKAVAAYESDCRRSIASALSSIEALGSRPEPHLLLAMCDTRFGRADLGLRAARAASRLDPDAWEYHYVLALVQGVTGRDPLPEARTAMRLNPREPLTADAVSQFTTRDPREWRRRALAAPLPLE